MDIETQKKLVEAIINPNKKEIKPYTTKATVSSVSDGIIYVKLPGSENSTPIKSSSVSVNPGDVVDISVSHDDSHITGNRSDVAAPESTTKQISKALEATRLEMDNTFDLFNNEIKMLNNNVDMQNNEIKMQNNTIEQINNTIEQQNNKITEIGDDITSIDNTIVSQDNKITEIGNTVNSQNNKITEIGNTVNSQNNKITEIGNKVNSQGNTITELNNTVNSQGNTITEIGNKVNSQNNKITEIGNTVDSQNNTITELNNTVTEIGNTVNSQGNTITEIENTVNSQGNTITQINNTIDQQNTEIETLDSNIKIINSAFVIQDGKLTGLSEIVTNILDAGYVTTDLLNADVAWIENGKIKEGAIGTVEIADESVTTAKIKDLSADVITTGTLKTECLILTTDEVDPETGEKKVALITALNAKVNSGEGNILDGAVIADDTIEAAKITVVDLNAFGATIGNFHIGTSSMYNGKESLKDPTNGVYLGTDGIALGQGSLLGMTDDSPFRVESDGDFHLGAKDSNYINFDAFTGELDINAKTIKMGSKSVASTEDVTTAINDIEVGGRNLLLRSANPANMFGWSRLSGSATITEETMLGAKGVLLDITTASTGWNFCWYSFGPSRMELIKPDTYYTLSFDVYPSTDDTINFVIMDGNATNAVSAYSGGKNMVANQWNHMSLTIKTHSTITISNQVIYIAGINSVATYKICNFKLEEGNKATDWTPAPEDMEASVNAKLESYATLEVTNNKISTAVTETKSYADGKASDAVSTAKSYTDQTAASISSTVEGIDGRMTQMEQNADGFTWTIDETAIVTSVNEYYKSTSPISLTGGEWSESQPTWTEGTYIWMRAKNTNGKGVPDYTTPVCITGNTGAQGDAGKDANQVVHIVDGNGISNMYIEFADITITAPYINTPISFRIVSRGYEASDVQLCFNSRNNTDPGIYYFRSNGNVPLWIQKTGTSTWRLIMMKNEPWGSLYINNYHNPVKSGVSVTWVSVHLESVPDGSIAADKLQEGREAAEAAKVATNYMDFGVYDNGLTIGNLTGSSVGRNVFIDSDSVDIRNGKNVLASYGEEIVLKNDGEDTFTIKKSEFLQTIKDAGRMFTGTVSSYSVGHVKYVQSTAILITADTYALRVKYNDGHDDEYFIFESTSTNSIYGWEWVSSNRSVLKLYLNSSQTSSFTVPCVYCDANAVSELTIRGNVVIHNDSDTNGSVKSLPPLIVGIPSSTHLEIDGDEIGAKTGEKTPSHLYLNMEGGNVSFNNNCERAIMIQDGAIFAKNRSPSIPTVLQARWVGIVDGIDEDGNTTFGYGGYLLEAGATHIYGNKIRLISNNGVEVNHTITVDGDIRIKNNVFGIFGTNTSGEYRRNFQPCNRANNCLVGYGSYEASEGATYIYGNNVELKSKNNIKTDCNIVLPNAKAIVGWNTLGTERLNIQPCNGNNNFVLGYGSYSASEGATNIYGNQLNFYTKNYLNSTRPLKVLWSGAHHMNASQTATLSEAVSTQLNGIVLVWSKYSGGAQNYEWNCFFVPKEMVSKHPGAGYSLMCIGTWPSYKYIYVNDQSITGNAANNSNNSINGVNYDSKNHCLRYVYGV